MMVGDSAHRLSTFPVRDHGAAPRPPGCNAARTCHTGSVHANPTQRDGQLSADGGGAAAGHVALFSARPAVRVPGLSADAHAHALVCPGAGPRAAPAPVAHRSAGGADGRCGPGDAAAAGAVGGGPDAFARLHRERTAAVPGTAALHGAHGAGTA